MKRKKIAGLIAIVAIVAVLIFSGCIERGEATPYTLTTPASKRIEASDGQVTIILDKIERADVMPPDIAEELSAGYPPRKIPTPTGGCNFVCIYLTIAQIENVHLVNPLGYGDERTVLLDVQGHEYEYIGALVRELRLLYPGNITGPTEVVEGATGFLVFEGPKHCIPVRLSFVYSFKETWEEKSAKMGQIDVYLPPISIQSKIDAAKPGDTIIIEDGIYIENVKVNKRLTIRSKSGPDKTIIQAATPQDPVFNVTSDYVNISGCTMKGAYTGMRLYTADYCNITGNNCSSNDVYGIDLRYSDNNSIFNNTCSNNNFGIYLNNSSNNLITNNNVSNNSRVFPFDFPPSQGTGIYLLNSSNNKIYLNNFINNYDNVHPSDLTNIWESTERITYGYRGTTYTNNLGNYWDDYEEKYPDAEEIDATGIWDTPYSIDRDKGNYPLKASFENYLLDFVSHSSPLNVSVTVAIDPVAPRNYSQVTVRVTTTEGTPLSDASVTVSATGGSLSPTSGTTDSKGEFKSTYTAPSVTTTQTYTISATASKAGYISGSGSATITVKTLPQSETVIIPSWEDPLVKIENQANRDVTVTFTGPTSATIYLEPGTTESKRFTPGVYSIHATALGASPATIHATLSKGYMYTLRIFEIVIRLP